METINDSGVTEVTIPRNSFESQSSCGRFRTLLLDLRECYGSLQHCQRYYQALRDISIATLAIAFVWKFDCVNSVDTEMAASPVPIPSLPNRSYQSSPSESPNLSATLPSPLILNEMVSQGVKPSHTCQSCSRLFSRAEHLDRHLTTHLPSNCSKSFICPSCGKGFTRKDVLTRHVRAVHETKKPDVRRSRRRSCRRCAGFKIKCSGGVRGSADGLKGDEACEACKKRGVVCIYDFSTTTDGIAERGEEAPGK